MSISDARITLAADHELDRRLRRIEGLLAIIVRGLDDQHADRDLDSEIATAYRRGYLAGHHAQRRGDPLDPDAALTRRRQPRTPRP